MHDESGRTDLAWSRIAPAGTFDMTSRSKEKRIVPRSLWIVLALGLSAFAPSAHAQTFPGGTVRIIVPFPAGGATDVLGRVLSVHLQNLWGPPVVSEYRPGAAGLLGTRQVASAPADGYTLLMASTGAILALAGDTPWPDRSTLPASWRRSR
jgi:tripartite-type tricarboxylate transporter receptor subunit TctC